MSRRSVTVLLLLLALALAGTGEHPAGQTTQAGELVIQLRLRAVGHASGKGLSEIAAAGELMHRHEVTTLDEIMLTYDGVRRWKVEAPDVDSSGIVTGDNGTEPMGDGEYSVSGGGTRFERIGGMAEQWIQLKNAEANWQYAVNPAANRTPMAIASDNGTLANGFVLQIQLQSADIFQAVQSFGRERIDEHKRGHRDQNVGTQDSKTLAHLILANAQDERFRRQMQVRIDRKLPRFSYSGHASYSKEEPIDLVQQGKSDARQRVSVEVDYTVSYNMPEEDVEAELIPEKGYLSWMPEAGGSEDADGNLLGVRVDLHRKGQPTATPAKKATFRFQLVGVSKEKGVCLNAPRFDEAKEDFDLRIDARESPDLKVEPDGQSAASTSASQGVSVAVRSHDWGAYGALRVTATLEDGQRVSIVVRGRPKQKQLAIPLDDNRNHVADAFERHFGIYDRNLPGTWDGADNPKGERADGDGIDLYEKYRGFEFAGAHERLDPHSKYVFVFDPDDLVKFAAADPLTADTGFAKVSGLKVRYVDMDHWTGPGSMADGKRIVNFNHGDATAAEQTALHVAVRDDLEHLQPPGWEEMLGKYGTRPPRSSIVAPGMSYPDIGAVFGSPKNTYQIVVSRTLIAVELEEHASSHMKTREEWQKATEDVRRFLLNQQKDVTVEEAKAGFPDRSTEWRQEFYRLVRAVEDAKTRLLEELRGYKAEHPDQWYGMNAKMLALVISHELTHGVGVRHHRSASWEGERACVIRYLEPSQDNCRKALDDAYDFRFYAQWPDTICRDPDHSHGGRGCRAQMIVSDRASADSAPGARKSGEQ